MSNKTIKNAVIESASISIERGFILSAWLTLDYGGSVQGFGGYSLYLSKSAKHHDEKSNFAGHWIYRVLEIAGVESWGHLKGKTVRVELDGPLGLIVGIGHIVKDDWFYPEKEFKDSRGEEAA